MRLALLSLILLLSAYTILASADSSAVNAAVAGYLGSGETFTKTLHVIGGNDYYFVSFNGTESMVFASDGGARLIQNKTELTELLAAELADKNITVALYYPNQTEKDQLWAYVLAFNNSRTRENDCEQIIGIDRFPCIDLETCWRACYTPACQTMKIGSGEFFLGHLMRWYSNKTQIDENVEEFHETLSTLPTDTNGFVQGIESLQANIQAIRDSAISIESNTIQLKEGIGFCYPANFQYSGLINASARLAMKRNALLPLFTLDESASLLYNRTQERIALRNTNMAKPACLDAKANAQVALSRAKSDASRALTYVTSEDMVAQSRALDAMSDGLNCSNTTLTLVAAFIPSFANASSNLTNLAVAAFQQYSAANSSLSAAKAALAPLQASSPNDAAVQALAAEVAALDTRMRMPRPADLPAITTDINGLSSRIVQANSVREVGGGGQQTMIQVAILLVLLVAAFIVYKVAFKRKGPRGLKDV